MINKLIIDGANVELTDKSQVPFSYTFAQAGTHVVRFGIDKTDEICAQAFKNCSDLSYIAFPDEIKNIKREAFMNCTSLERVPLSKNIEYIGKDAFTGCTSLTDVSFEHDNPPQMYCTFPSQTILYVPNGQKYEEVAYEKLNLDGNTMYFTQNAYSHAYERIYDITFATEYEVDADGNPVYELDADGNLIDETDANGNKIYVLDDEGNPTTETVKKKKKAVYYQNKWDKYGDNDHVVEQKNRYPVTNIDFSRNVNVASGSTFELSYTLSPENVTNTQLYWYSSLPNVFEIDTNTGVPGMVKVKGVGTGIGSRGYITAYAESGVSFRSEFTLTN